MDGGGVPVIPQYGERGGTVESVRLLNLVEEHSLCFFYDGEAGEIELCDDFCHEQLFDSPYSFGSGRIDTSDPLVRHGLLRGGTRRVRGAGGGVRDHQVFLEFLPYSTTDYVPCLEEGDFPRCFQLMGRLFRGDLREERCRRLEEGTSAIPSVLEKMRAWQVRQGTATRQRQVLNQRFVRVLLELAPGPAGSRGVARMWDGSGISYPGLREYEGLPGTVRPVPRIPGWKTRHGE